ncbi:MAG: acylphosphatase [Pseudomonadota bacterium]
MADDRIALRLRVIGRVQGVWFRAWTVKQASALKLDGWVRNRTDGSVEILAAGPSGAVDRLLALCKDGPRNARVVDVCSNPAEDPGPTGFDLRPTA